MQLEILRLDPESEGCAGLYGTAQRSLHRRGQGGAGLRDARSEGGAGGGAARAGVEGKRERAGRMEGTECGDRNRHPRVFPFPGRTAVGRPGSHH